MTSKRPGAGSAARDGDSSNDPEGPTSLDRQPRAVVSVIAWPDPVIDRVGHDPRSAYVERYWLGVLGPSCVLLARTLADRLEAEPDGFTLDVAECAQSLGLGTGVGRHAPLSRTITRLTQFGMAQRYGRDGLALRRHFPPLSPHHLARLPAGLQRAHEAETMATARLRPDAA
ncbi:MAG: hypothetical protein GEV08_14675 [Acidimicrobiia bacterium]|nr:hypothetical protein [Acidimicrobiia bacterium]